MTKPAGSELRDTVASLLRTRFDFVETEYRIDTTTADIMYTDTSNKLFPTKIAIECKDWTRSLNSKDISDIYNSYQPSFSSGEIDKLLIISRKELSQSPMDTVRRLPNTQHSTYEQFVGSSMDFQLLLQENIAAFKNHESSKNFIPPRCLNEECELEASVLQWLEDTTCPAALVYGGYGLGKTTFSYYLASTLSSKFRKNEFSRVPIRIPLGGLFTKQDLKALICSELTGAEGQPAVGNFSYNIFLQMVHQGFILLILDGFDEMRHAMSAEDFKFTFEQMSPLFEEKSKVIVLGRPDAFFDNEEESDFIDALLNSSSENKDRVRKLEVDKFSKSEVDSYLENFLTSEHKDNSNYKRISQFKDEEYDVLCGSFGSIRSIMLNN